MSLNIDRIPACLRLETTTIRGTRERERILYKLTKTRKGCIDNRRSSLIKRIITLLVIAEIGKLWGTIEKPVTPILLLYQPFGIRNIARYFRIYAHIRTREFSFFNNSEYSEWKAATPVVPYHRRSSLRSRRRLRDAAVLPRLIINDVPLIEMALSLIVRRSPRKEYR